MCKIKELEKVKVITLAGGLGSRVMSSVPKPFMYIGRERIALRDICSLFEEAEFDYGDMYSVITNEEQARLCRERVKALPSGNILNFDSRFGYIAVIGKAANRVAELSDAEIVIVVAGDSYFEDRGEFVRTIHKMIEITRKTGQATIAGVPTGDAQVMTGLGVLVLDKSDKIDDSYGLNYKKCVEKPTLSKAEELMREEKTLGNSGVYCIPVSIIKEMYPEKELDEQLDAFIESGSSNRDMNLKVPEFIEKLKFRAVRLDAGWRDLGTMGSLYQVQQIGPRHRNATISISEPGSVRTNCRKTFFFTDIGGVTIYGVNIDSCTLAAIEKNGRLCVTAYPYALDQMAGLITKLFNDEKLTKQEQAAYDLLKGENNGCRVVRTNMTNHNEEDAPCIVPLGMQDVTFVLNEVSTGNVSVIISAEHRHSCTVSDEIIAEAFKKLREKS